MPVSHGAGRSKWCKEVRKTLWLPLSHQNSECVWCKTMFISSGHCWHNILFCFNYVLRANMCVSTPIPKLAMIPPLAHPRSKSSTHSASKWDRNLSAESNALKLGLVLDRWRVMDSLVHLFGWILASIGRWDAKKSEANHWIEEINAHNFFNPNAFSVVDILPQDEHLAA
jgi:hypothetical protein